MAAAPPEHDDRLAVLEGFLASLATGRAYRLELRYPDGRPVTVWVDSTSALEVRRAYTRSVGGQLVPMETDIGDYRAVEGVQEPHRLITRIPAFGVTMTLRMVRVDVNPDIPGSRFERSYRGGTGSDTPFTSIHSVKASSPGTAAITTTTSSIGAADGTSSAPKLCVR
jgi:hypothetical protein